MPLLSSPICRSWRPILSFSLAVLLLSCQRPSRSAPQSATSTGDPFAELVPHSREADDAGRFLAGLPGTEGSPFLELEKTAAWKLHRRELDKAWAGFEAETIPAMRNFQKQELGDPPLENSVVLYPFSGPDSLVLSVFFPKNPTYVMVALEPAGTLPRPKQFAKPDIAGRLAAVRATVSSELHRSFFITRQMDRQFRGQVTDGLFPPIISLLVRTNHTVVGYRYVRLDEQGHLVERPAPSGSSGKIANRGVEIDFRTDADQSLHKLVYLSVNLANQRLRDNQPFLTFLHCLKGMTSYFKATSYLTHQAEFSIIRDETLANSTAILQDDSGIPYRFFAGGPWQVQLYGGYVRPYGSFRWLEQPDLRKAYVTEHPKPLGFAIGYGFSRTPSNLLFAGKTSVGSHTK